MPLNRDELNLLVAFFELLAEIDQQAEYDTSEQYNNSNMGRNQ